MKSVRLAALAFLVASVAALAAPAPGPAPLSDAALAAILGEPLGATACAKDNASPAQAGGLPPKTATCTAQCAGGGTVTCTSPTSCSYMNANCAWLQPGYVNCNGVTTTCTPGCCSTGTQRDRACCRCAATAGCVDCCRCDGGTVVQCSLQCG